MVRDRNIIEKEKGERGGSGFEGEHRMWRIERKKNYASEKK